MAAVESIWHTTVDEVMRLFRDALVALLPTLGRAKIPWHDDESYDNWQNIAQVLFDEIVQESCRYAVADYEMVLPRYQLRQESYLDKSYIRVLPPDRKIEDATDLAFLSFDPNDGTFGVSRCVRLMDNVLAEDVIVRVPVDSCAFELVHRSKDGSSRMVRDLAVQN